MAESEMIERVARTMWQIRRQTAADLWPLPPWEEENETLRDDVRREAEAAIEAIMQELADEAQKLGLGY